MSDSFGTVVHFIRMLVVPVACPDMFCGGFPGTG